MATFFPKAPEYFTKGLAFSWHHQPYTHGGWPAFKPNQIGAIAALQRAEGQVRFAGDHTCLYTGWAQGALESAHFATAEVIASCQADGRSLAEAKASSRVAAYFLIANRQADRVKWPLARVGLRPPLAGPIERGHRRSG